MFFKIDVFKNFAKFTGKHSCVKVSFYIKVKGFFHRTTPVAASIFENYSFNPINFRPAVGVEVGPGNLLSKSNSATTKMYESEQWCKRFLFQNFTYGQFITKTQFNRLMPGFHQALKG